MRLTMKEKKKAVAIVARGIRKRAKATGRGCDSDATARELSGAVTQTPRPVS